MVAHAWNPRTWETEEEDQELKVFLSYTVNWRLVWGCMRACVKQTNKAKAGEKVL